MHAPHHAPPPRTIIARKRDGNALTDEEIAAFVAGAATGSWADYQLAAMLMALFLQKMTPAETAAYTRAMTASGAVLNFADVPHAKVDKHSSGGVGDNVSIHLAAMVAACGVAVPMISGRGLGHTGGTLDKLEAIPGYRVGLTLREVEQQVREIGVAIVGASPEIAPADRTWAKRAHCQLLTVLATRARVFPRDLERSCVWL